MTSASPSKPPSKPSSDELRRSVSQNTATISMSMANESVRSFRWVIITLCLTMTMLLLTFHRSMVDDVGTGTRAYDRKADGDFAMVPKYASLNSKNDVMKEEQEEEEESSGDSVRDSKEETNKSQKRSKERPFQTFQYKEDHSEQIVGGSVSSKSHSSQQQQSIFSHPTSAAEKLQCSEKVVSNVIYATDAVDECEGLRKAFDKTCSSSSSVKSSSSSSSMEDKEEGSDVNRRRRLLAPIMNLDKRGQEIEKEHGEDVFEVRLTRGLQDLYRRLVPKQSSKDSEDHKKQSKDNEASMLEDDDEDAESRKKHNTPSLPTSSQHIDQQMLNGAVSLNEERTSNAIAEEIIKNVYESKNSTDKSLKHGTTNGTEAADVSEEAIEIAAAAVEAVMNSPESIEMRTCCASIMDIYHEECDTTGQEEYDDKRLFIIIFIIAICGLVKSLIRHFKIRWLPEAGGCILVGVFVGFFLQFFPHIDFAFHHAVFLRVMVPPIVFEAALNIDKNSFNRMLVPIMIYAVLGTLMSTFLTAFVVYYGTAALGQWCTPIPFIESLLFGSLISSIDPIAVLSVLNNMGMSDRDVIYVLIFGESLLNDGVAIVLFETLVNFLDDYLVIDGEAVWIATIQFCVIAIGSVTIGLFSAAIATVFFWSMKGIQTPLVEVLMFLCCAFIPYYICDGVEWSGIVAIVTAGFFMDIYIVGNRVEGNEDSKIQNQTKSQRPVGMMKAIFSQEGFLSSKAKNHIGFVTEINSTLMETAIFAYLGIFLFSKRYNWSFWLPTIAIIACIVSRTIMVGSLSLFANMLTRVGRRTLRRACSDTRSEESSSITHCTKNSVFIDSRMQIVLIFAGLRGAMSFALVETIPMYDQDAGEGTRLKPELKAMTSASIVFTVFVFGGYTYYLLEQLGLSVGKSNDEDVEMSSLIERKSSAKEQDKFFGDELSFDVEAEPSSPDILTQRHSSSLTS